MKILKTGTLAIAILVPAPLLAQGPAILLPEALLSEQPASPEPADGVAAANAENAPSPQAPKSVPRPRPRPEGLGKKAAAEAAARAAADPEEGITLDPALVPAAFGKTAGGTEWRLGAPAETLAIHFGDITETPFDPARFTIVPTEAVPSPEYLAAERAKEEQRLAEEAYRQFLLTPEGRYTAMARDELAARYGTDLAPDEEGRFVELASGQAEEDYAWRPDRLAALSVSNAEYRMEEGSMAARRAALERLKAYMETPQGAAALAKMSPQQMLALTGMMAVIEESSAVMPIAANAAADIPVVSSAALQASLPGVPSLTFRPETDDAAPVASVRDVGGNQNLLLSGWNVGVDGTGRVVMFRGDDMDSGIEIAEGMVMGALGPIVEIRTVSDELIVRFSTGDEIKGNVG